MKKRREAPGAGLPQPSDESVEETMHLCSLSD